MFIEHLVYGKHHPKGFTCINLLKLHKVLRRWHYYYPYFMDVGTERLNKGDSSLDLVLTRRKKSRNGSTGGLMGA